MAHLTALCRWASIWARVKPCWKGHRKLSGVAAEYLSSARVKISVRLLFAWLCAENSLWIAAGM